MKLSRRVALDGIQLDEVDASVVIQGADPGTPRESISAVSVWGGSGQRITGEHFDVLEASVTYAINKPKESMADRRTVFDKVNKWAKKGWLTMNFMTGKRMRVDKVILPAMGDPRNQSSEWTITFRAYNVPFWQDATATSVTDTLTAATEKTKTVSNPGNATTVLDVEFTNTSGETCTTFEVKIGTKKLELTGLSLANNAKLTIGHGTDGRLTITAGSANVYGKQTAGGLTDLYLQPGDNTVKVKAEKAGSVTLSCYGRYI